MAARKPHLDQPALAWRKIESIGFFGMMAASTASIGLSNIFGTGGSGRVAFIVANAVLLTLSLYLLFRELTPRRAQSSRQSTIDATRSRPRFFFVTLFRVFMAIGATHLFVQAWVFRSDISMMWMKMGAGFLGLSVFFGIGLFADLMLPAKQQAK